MDFSKFGKKIKPDSVEAEASKMALSSLRDEAKKGMVDGLKKVTVASKDKEGLKAGLEKAKEIVEKGPELVDSEEGMESKEMETQEILDCMETPEQIDELVAKLHEKKAELMTKTL